MTGEKPKEEYYREAAQYLNTSDRVGTESGEGVSTTLAFLTRGVWLPFDSLTSTYSSYSGIQQLATGSLKDAYASFDIVLQQHPTNLVALLGQGRVLYAERKFSEALKTFRRVLELNPRCQPDPRIGIGLCFWAMENKAMAKAAWERSLEVVCSF